MGGAALLLEPLLLLLLLLPLMYLVVPITQRLVTVDDDGERKLGYGQGSDRAENNSGSSLTKNDALEKGLAAVTATRDTTTSPLTMLLRYLPATLVAAVILTIPLIMVTCY